MIVGHNHGVRTDTPAREADPLLMDSNPPAMCISERAPIKNNIRYSVDSSNGVITRTSDVTPIEPVQSTVSLTIPWCFASK